MPPLRLVGTQQTQVTKLVRDQFLTLLRNILQPLLCNFFNYHFVGRKSGLIFSSHKKIRLLSSFFQQVVAGGTVFTRRAGCWGPPHQWDGWTFVFLVTLVVQQQLQLFSWAFLCSCCFNCFLGHSCAVLLQVFPWTFLYSCCFNCILGHSCAVVASIVFVDILVQLLLQLFFLRHSCAAASSRLNTTWSQSEEILLKIFHFKVLHL